MIGTDAKRRCSSWIMGVKMHHLLVALISISFFSILSGQAANAAYFMRLSSSAKASAMGNAGIVQIDDAAAVHWNPANLMQMESQHLSLLHSQYFISDVNYDFASYVVPAKNHRLGIAFSRLGVDNIADTRNAQYIANGGDWRLDYSRINRFSTADYVAYFAYASNWSKSVDVGVTAKLIYRDFGDENGLGIGFDLGTSFRPTEALTLAAVVQDITTSPVFYSTNTSEYSLPRVRLGAGYSQALAELDIFIRPVLQLDIGFDGSAGALFNSGQMTFDLPVGMEIAYTDRFALRAGLDSNREATLGAGFRLGGLYLDYSYSGYSNALGNIHVISLNANLERLLQ
jgi:long-subunit fatty acid transport protein